MADIIEVVRVIPQYSVVDLNKKRKNRSISANFEHSDSCNEVPTVDKREKSSSDLVHAINRSNEYHPGEEEDAVDSAIADNSSPELILEDTKTVVAVEDTNTQISECNVTNPANSRSVKSFYTPISKITLDSNRNPQALCYEDTNCNKIHTKKKRKKFKSCLKIKMPFLSLSMFLVLIAAFSFSVITFVEVTSLTSKLDIPSDESGRSFEELLNSISLLQEILNSSIVLANERYEVLESKTQQLLSTLESLGQPSSPAASCAALLDFSPSSPSGHYWVRSSNGTAVHMYCDMTRSCGNITGGWTRVSSINILENDTQCPGNLLKREDSNTCGVQIVAFSLPYCSSVNFFVNSIRYSKVCGKIKAFPVGSLEAFHGIFHSIDHAYVDGISLTYGHPRQHIWTLAAGTSESNVSCPCTNNCQANSTTPPPSFVGKDYFCDTGSKDHSDPLWNGGNCIAMNTYSSSNSASPPLFYRNLPYPATEDIEMRVCSDESRSNEDIAIEAIEIYVQ